MPDNPSQYPHELIGGGKDGRIFVMNRDNMGQYQTTDHVIQEVQTGTQEFDNIFATPTLWNGTIYYHCEQDVVKAYSWDSSTGLLSTSPISQGTISLWHPRSNIFTVGQWHIRRNPVGDRKHKCPYQRSCYPACL